MGVTDLELDTALHKDRGIARPVTDQTGVFGLGRGYQNWHTPDSLRARFGGATEDIDTVSGAEQADVLPVVGMEYHG